MWKKADRDGTNKLNIHIHTHTCISNAQRKTEDNIGKD